jgi:hypothetical protein
VFLPIVVIGAGAEADGSDVPNMVQISPVEAPLRVDL